MRKIKFRIELKGERVALYVPDELNQSETFKTNAKSITGWRYCRNDFGWYYPLDKAVEALNYLFSLYDTEPELEDIIALIEQQQVEA